MSERQKMLNGLPYDAGSAELVELRKAAQLLIRLYNQTVIGDEQRESLLTDLLGAWNGAVICPPFHADYGANIYFGPGCFVNFGGVMLDVCEIRLGARVQIGPNVQLLTADHPRQAAARATGVEWGRPIVIGDDVWIGGGAIILPGVTIGAGAIVGAGAVVTRDVASGVTVAGNPARQLQSGQTA